MREIEKKIILAIEVFNRTKCSRDEYVIEKLMIEYKKNFFGDSTSEFLNTSILKKYLEKEKYENVKYWIEKDSIRLWMNIENYICANLEEKGPYFALVKLTVKKIKKEIYKPSGQGLFKQISRDLIRNIYLSNDRALISLFMKKLPIPRAEIFKGYPLPEILLDKEKQEQTSVEDFLKNPRLNWEKILINIQRHIRYKNRQKQERHRIAGYQCGPRFGLPEFENETPQQLDSSTRAALKNANTPYYPGPKHCSPELAEKIVKAAAKVKLFDTVRHLTFESYLNEILDEGLMGRRMLLEKYISFKPAALAESDLEYGGGDANVICFAPHEIDPKANQVDSIEIIMHLNKIEKNRCIFYKQRDLGFRNGSSSQITIKNRSFYFTHLKELRIEFPGYTNLQFSRNFAGEGEDFIVYSLLPNFLFSGYDQAKIHQILTLNFFRYVDRLFDSHTGLYEQFFAKSIYYALGQLSQEELIDCLQEIGVQMTSTAEFNFYGMYKIDFSAVKSIKNKSFCLDFSEFISALQYGNVEVLNNAKEKIPNLFKSHRFLNYLLSVPESKDYPELIQHELKIMRSLCAAPAYLTPSYNARRYQEETKMPPLSECRELDAKQLRKSMHNIL